MQRIAAFAALLVAPVFTLAQSSDKIEVEVTLDVASKYVWHGLDIDDEWVLQPGFLLSRDGFSFGFWGNLELTDWNEPNYNKNPQGKFSELDLWLEYGSEYGDHSWSVGVVDYQFPGTGEARYREWFGSLGTSKPWGDLTLFLATGNNDYTGTYASLTIERSVELEGGLPLDYSASLSWGDARSNLYLYDYDKSGMSDVHLVAGTSLEVGGGWTLAPSAHYSTLLNKNMIPGEPNRTNLWFEFSFGFGF